MSNDQMTMDRRTVLSCAVGLALLTVLAEPKQRCFPRDLLDRVHAIGRNTAGGPAQLRAALEAEFGPGEVVFRDEIATVLVDVSGVYQFPESGPGRVIPMRIVEPAARRSRDWIAVLYGSPDHGDYFNRG